MAKKKIIKYGDKVLRVKAKPVTVFHKKLEELIDEMVEIVCSKDGGAGLAAPQIGVSKRIVIIQSDDGILELINPEISKHSGEQVGSEGCLSLRGFYGIVKRAEYVKVKAMNRKGGKFQLEAQGFLARCIQHECDHLDGILYIDRIETDEFYNEKTKQIADLAQCRNVSRGLDVRK